MIKKYCFGTPFQTDSVILNFTISENLPAHISYKNNCFTLQLSDDDIVYGLGENIRGINKRGWVYDSFCMDDFIHSEDKHNLYGAHNFLIISGEKNTGIFIDIPGQVRFDIGYSHYNKLTISPSSSDFYLYIIDGTSPDDVVSQFRNIIGRSYIAPKWALGYGMSRWSYMNSDEIRQVIENHRNNDLPIDSIYLDIDYLDNYKDFTINNDSFGDFDILVEDVKSDNIHLVPIIDAGIKVEEGYEIYEEGVRNNYFCKDIDGNDYIVGVWPGNCVLPDVLNKEAREWFGMKYKMLTDKGIDGFWNDMNEPALFYSKNRLLDAQNIIAQNVREDMSIYEFFDFTNIPGKLKNSKDDYSSFYHNADGKKVCHIDVHNLFGYNMTRAAGEAFDKISPDKRLLLFSRASYIGMHRYGGIWQGDNMAWWSHLLLNIKMMPSLNMCGFIYTGADLGGFGADTTEDLLIRWLSFAVFTPLMRNHSAMGTRRQEVYSFDRTDLFRNVLKTRYKLLPYIYSEYMKASLNNAMMFRPLGFVYAGDRIARQVEDQLLVGEEIMIAPVHEQNATGRVVYFPEKMQLIRFTNDSITEEAVYEKGHHYIEMPLGDICIFLRENRTIPIGPGGSHVSDDLYNNLIKYSFGNNPLPYKLYNDDGYTKGFSANNIKEI